VIRVLFVDDEAAVLEGLENRLRYLRKQWQMTFVQGANRAIQQLSQERFDVVVTDMRMPEMDGDTLLGKIKQDYPDMVRIVLSGQTNKESVLRALSVAHQVLAKPCDAKQLEMAINRARSVHQLLCNQRIRDVVHGIERLPALPKLYLQLTQALEIADVSLPDLAHIIQQDIAMSSYILRVVNSGFFAFNHPIHAMQDAIAYLGLTTIRSLVLSFELFSALEVGKTVPGFSLAALQEHSFRSAKIAARLVSDEELSKIAFSAAMLHDVGALVMATSLPEFCRPVVLNAVQDHKPVYVAEEDMHGFTHSEIGGYLLALWGVPYAIIEAVVHHHQPRRSTELVFGVVGAVHVADRLAHEWCVYFGHTQKRDFSDSMDLEYLARVNVLDRIEGWRKTFVEQNVAG
jgi:HD-like signal output (HDOD) protein